MPAVTTAFHEKHVLDKVSSLLSACLTSSLAVHPLLKVTVHLGRSSKPVEPAVPVPVRIKMTLLLVPQTVSRVCA